MSWRTGVNTGYKGPAPLSRRCPSCRQWRRWSLSALIRHILQKHMAAAA